MWMESVKRDFLAALSRRPEFEVVDGLDFRKAHVRNGNVWLNDRCFDDVNVFFWFGELDRGHSSYDLEVLDAIGGKTKVVNKAASMRIALDKLFTQLLLHRNGVPVPEFFAVSRENVEQIRDVVERKLLLLKPRTGSFGVGITKVANFDQLMDIIDYSEQRAHFLEEFIDYAPEDFIGVNVIGNTVVSGYAKELSKFRGWKVFDRHRRGGGMVAKAPSARQRQIALDVARITSLDILGVDIIHSTSGQDYVVDVNTFPGLYPDLNAEFGCDISELLVNVIASKVESFRAAPVLL
jgi:glutathione synthase/RimK-type ligase-like ATP-grasp enzyme